MCQLYHTKLQPFEKNILSRNTSRKKPRSRVETFVIFIVPCRIELTQSRHNTVRSLSRKVKNPLGI